MLIDFNEATLHHVDAWQSRMSFATLSSLHSPSLRPSWRSLATPLAWAPSLEVAEMWTTLELQLEAAWWNVWNRCWKMFLSWPLLTNMPWWAEPVLQTRAGCLLQQKVSWQERIISTLNSSVASSIVQLVFFESASHSDTLQHVFLRPRCSRDGAHGLVHPEPESLRRDHSSISPQGCPAAYSILPVNPGSPAWKPNTNFGSVSLGSKVLHLQAVQTFFYMSRRSWFFQQHLALLQSWSKATLQSTRHGIATMPARPSSSSCARPNPDTTSRRLSRQSRTQRSRMMTKSIQSRKGKLVVAVVAGHPRNPSARAGVAKQRARDEERAKAKDPKSERPALMRATKKRIFLKKMKRTASYSNLFTWHVFSYWWHFIVLSHPVVVESLNLARRMKPVKPAMMMMKKRILCKVPFLAD